MNFILLGILIFFSGMLHASVTVSTPSSAIIGNSFNISFNTSGTAKYELYENGRRLTTRTSSPISRKPLSTGKYSYIMRRCVNGTCEAFGNTTTVSVLPASVSISVSSSSVLAGNAVRISFNDSKGGYYELYENGRSLTKRSSSAIDRTLKVSGNYSYRMRRCENGVCGSFGGTKSVKVSPAKVSISTSASSITQGDKVNISFDDSKAGYYELFENGRSLTKRTSSPISRTILNAGDYTYTMRRCENGICGALGSAKKVKANAISGVSIASSSNDIISGKSISISFNDNDVGYYELYENNRSFTKRYNSPIVRGPLSSGSYSYKMRRCNGSACGNFGNTITVNVTEIKSVTASVSDLTVTQGDVVDISFNDSEAGSYELYENGDLLASRSSSPISRTLLNSGRFDYKIRRCVSGVCGNFGNTVSVNVASISPISISSSSTSMQLGQSTAIDFNDSADGAYELFENGTLLTRHTSAPIVRKPTSAGLYKWKMRRCRNNACGAFGPEISLEVKAAELPNPTISNLQYTPAHVLVGESQVFSFDYTNATKCYAKPASSGNGNINVSEEVYYSGQMDSGTYSLSLDRTSAATYSFTVTCTNESGKEAEAHVSTEIKEPLTVPTLTVQFMNQSKVNYKVEWSAVVEADVYQLEQSVDAGLTWQLLETSTVLFKEFNNAAPGDYTYRVSACRVNQDCGLPSIETSISVQPQNKTRKIIFIHTDLLGSPVAETNEKGVIQ